MADPQRAAIVIGNGVYQEGRLDNPPGDAEAIDRRLMELGFRTVFRRDLTREGMFETLDEFRRRFPATAVALLFYAGHGLQQQAKNFLLPVETKIRRPADITRFGIDLDYFLDLFEEVSATSLVFLDCCRDNPFYDQIMINRKADQRDLVPFRSGLAANAANRNGTLIAYATKPDSTAEDGRGQHSPFTQALLDQLGLPNQSISDMMIDITSQVLNLTNSRQHPWYLVSLQQHVILNPQEVTPVPAGALEPGADQAAWLAISASNSISVFDDFIRTYPTSTFSDHARTRIRHIQTTNEEARQALASAGQRGPGRLDASSIRPFDRSKVAPALPRSGRKSASLGQLNMSHPAFHEGLVAISVYSVAKIVTRAGRGVGTAFFVSGADLFGPADTRVYALTASHVVGAQGADFAAGPGEVLLLFEEMNERGKPTAPLPVADIVWQSEPWGRGCDATILGFGSDVPDFVEPIPVARDLPDLDPNRPLSFASRPRVISISFPYANGIRFGTIDNYLLDYDRPTLDEQGQPVDAVIQLHYTAASEPGSSGCPILDEHLEVIGLHVGGHDRVDRLNGLGGQYAANFGVWIQSIIKDARR